MSKYITMHRKQFLEVRKRNYEEALLHKEDIAKSYGVELEDVIINTPPEEVICDGCNKEVLDTIVFLKEDGSRLHCPDCLREFGGINEK